MTMRLTLALASLFFVAGCAGGGSREDFSRRVNKIREGMTQSQVRDELGAPDSKSGGVVDLSPTPSPGRVLVGRVPAGARYEDWFYRRGDTHYHVLFARGTTHPGRWEVARTVAGPADAAVGRTDPVPPGR